MGASTLGTIGAAKPPNSPQRTGARAAGEDGWGEVVVLSVFAAVIGLAFLWALVLHEREPEPRTVATTRDPTATTSAPPTLGPPRRYRVTDGVNIRQGPAVNTALVARLEEGTQIVVECYVEGQYIVTSEGSTDLWLRVQLDTGPAFVSSLYVDTRGDLDDRTRLLNCAFG